MATVVLAFGDDLPTDRIYPGTYLTTVSPAETPRHAFADDVDFHTRLLRGEIAPGSVIVGGTNFGCGSAREQAVSALRGHGLVIVARSVARIFLRNAVNLGLRIVIVPGIEARAGDELELYERVVVNTTTGCDYAVHPLPRAMQAVMDAGGLVPYVRQRLIANEAQRSR